MLFRSHERQVVLDQGMVLGPGPGRDGGHRLANVAAYAVPAQRAQGRGDQLLLAAAGGHWKEPAPGWARLGSQGGLEIVPQGPAGKWW